MGFRTPVHVVGKLCKRLTRRPGHSEAKTKPTEPAEIPVKTDAQAPSPVEDDNTRTRTEPANLDNLPTELLLAIAKAVSRGWKPQLQLLAAMVQLNRKLATMLLPETRQIFLRLVRSPH